MDILQKLKAKSRAAIQNLRPTDYQDAAIIQPETNAFGTILGQGTPAMPPSLHMQSWTRPGVIALNLPLPRRTS